MGPSTRSMSMDSTLSPPDTKRSTQKIKSNFTVLKPTKQKKTPVVAGKSGIAKKEPTNATKKEEQQEKTKITLAKMQKYFEITREVEEEEEDSEIENPPKLPNAEKPETEDPEVINLRKQLIPLCDLPDISKRRSLELERGLLAINYMKMITAKSTRIPPSTKGAIDQALQIVINSLVELEIRNKHAEAKMETLEQVSERRTTNQYEEELAPVAQEAIQKTKMARTYAQAVQEATATVIIQAKENRSAEEVENQITKSVENKEGIKNVKRIRNGVKIVCESAEQAARIKDALAENEAENGGLSVKTANLKRKRVIIFHVPESVEENVIICKICKQLGLKTEDDADCIRLLKPIRAPAGKVHIPVSLPESLANHMLKEKTICLGLRECPVKNYVTIQRCHRCQGFDHIASQCKQTNEFCPICSGNHKYENCPKERECCALCITYNEWNKGHLTAPLPVNHTAHDGRCRIYQKLLKIRQIELDKGKTKLTTGDEVLKDKVTVNTFRGVTRVYRRTEAEIQEREQRVQELKRINYGTIRR